MTLAKALRQGPLFAFNIDSFLTLKAVAAAVVETRQPTIVAVSEGEAEFWGLPRFQTWGLSHFQALVASYRQQGLPLFLNLDHGHSPALINQALSLGFDMVHLDASDLPLRENIRRARQLVTRAHRQNTLVEVEPDSDQVFTNPDHLRQICQTGADLVAVFSGNRHGYRPRHAEYLDLGHLAQLKAASPCWLTLHGGSGVYRPHLEAAFQKNLIRKVNVNSRLRWLFRYYWQKSLRQNKSFRYYQLARPVVAALKKQILNYFRLLP